MAPFPPLKAVRYFESAARHLSFSKAAEELNLTQSAISHSVRGLEEHLGTRLFLRAGRANLRRSLRRSSTCAHTKPAT